MKRSAAEASAPAPGTAHPPASSTWRPRAEPGPRAGPPRRPWRAAACPRRHGLRRAAGPSRSPPAAAPGGDAAGPLRDRTGPWAPLRALSTDARAGRPGTSEQPLLVGSACGPGLDRMLLEARRAPRPLLPPGLRRDGAQRRVFVSGFRPCVVPLPRLSSRRSVFGEQFGEWVGFGLGEAYTGAVGVGGVEVEDGDGAEGAAALGCEGVLGADVGGGVVAMGRCSSGPPVAGGCPVAAAAVGRCGV